MTYFYQMIVLCACLFWALPATAEGGVRYYKDPVYKKLSDEDHHPMDEMLNLAGQGDARAQFILGDMYSKGKGGLPKNLKEARRWFGESAIHGYSNSFIRLAALAKKENKPAEAWQWYTLAIEEFDYGDERQYAIRARKELVESAGLSPEDIRQARESQRDWQEARSRQLRAEREAARERERLEREREKAEKSQQKEEKNEQD